MQTDSLQLGVFLTPVDEWIPYVGKLWVFPRYDVE